MKKLKRHKKENNRMFGNTGTDVEEIQRYANFIENKGLSRF